MMKRISELKNEALNSLRGSWLISILSFFLLSMIISFVVSIIVSIFMGVAFLILGISGFDLNSIFSPTISNNPSIYDFKYLIIFYLIYFILLFAIIIISSPLSIGYFSYTLKLARDKNKDINNVFDGVKIFKKSLICYTLVFIYQMLWSFLFIIPGIIASLRYSQAFYILFENPDISPSEAISQSSKMMEGYKLKYFLLSLSFIGWYILSIFTLFIGTYIIYPYQYVTFAHFYLNLKDEKNQQLA